MSQIKKIKELNKNKRGTDPFVRYVVRPLSNYFAIPFVKMGVKANIVTLLSFITGITGAGLLAAGFRYSTIILLFISHILDGVDGTVARVTNSSSAWGRYLDGVSGFTINLSIWIALSYMAYSLSLEDEISKWYSYLALILASVELLTNHMNLRQLLYIQWVAEKDEKVKQALRSKLETKDREKYKTSTTIELLNEYSGLVKKLMQVSYKILKTIQEIRFSIEFTLLTLCVIGGYIKLYLIVMTIIVVMEYIYIWAMAIFYYRKLVLKSKL